MAELARSGAAIDCPGCGDVITMPITVSTDPQSRPAAVSVLASVDTGPVRDHVAERHPERLSDYDEAADQVAAEVLP